jgi:hypothetical protein
MFRLRSIGVLSCAKIFAVIQGAIGIVVGFLFLLFALVGAAFMPAQQRLGMVGMIVIAVLMPVFYAVIGFTVGAIWPAVYNLTAQAIGGLELQLDTIHQPTYAPPSPPYAPPSVAGA